jgi:hypothetical protein
MKRNVLYRGKTAWNTWTEGFYVYDKTLDQHMIWSGAGFIEVMEILFRNLPDFLLKFLKEIS